MPSLFIIVGASLWLLVVFFWGVAILKFLLRAVLFVLFGWIGFTCTGISFYLWSEVGARELPPYFIALPILGLVSLLVAWRAARSLLLRLTLIPPSALCCWLLYLALTHLPGS